MVMNQYSMPATKREGEYPVNLPNYTYSLLRQKGGDAQVIEKKRRDFGHAAVNFKGPRFLFPRCLFRHRGQLGELHPDAADIHRRHGGGGRNITQEKNF